MAKKKSSKTEKLFTYRGGKKLELVKRPDQFVVRRLPEELSIENVISVEQTSSASTRVTCDPSDLDAMISDARVSAPAHHAYEDAESKQPFLITDRIMVRFAEDVDEMGVAEFAGDYALEILDKLSPRDYLFRLTDETGMNPVKLIVELTEEDVRVDTVDHDLNQIFKTCQTLIPDDPQYTGQWHLHQRRTASPAYDPRSSAGVEGAWQQLGNHGSADVVVGVADDGCQLDHDDFDSANKFAGWGYFQGTTLKQQGDIGADADSMYQDGANHGTACCGVIGAEVDGEMTVGVAPNCRLLPVKWESSGSSLFISDSKLLTALRYMDSRVDVISNSWGSSPSSSWSSIVLSTIDDMARTGGRRGNGVVFLWAAGNENCPISHSASVDVPYSDGWEPVRNRFGEIRWRWVGVETSRVFSDDLALLDSILTVAALSSTAQRSHYSCYGTGIDITAPSSNSHAYYRIELPGLGIVTTKGRDTIRDNFGGTSSATPLVAAVAALVISANDALSAAEVIQILKQTASKDLDMTAWPKTPAATFDPDTSWDVSPVAPFDAGDFNDIGSSDGTWSPWFGHGRVDARAAVARALELRGDQSTGLSVSRAVNHVIPDDNLGGVHSSINVTERGRIASIVVNVSITHTWRGDLRVALLGPEGERVVLHDRQGGSADDLEKSFEAEEVPGLSIFLGTEVHGAWTLQVVDQARADTGTLNEWGIDFEIQRSSELRYESRPAAQIPDNHPAGIFDTVEVSENQTVTELAVEVDITHSWKGDLRVSISAPDGDTVMLHNQTGRQQDNIRETYSAANRPELVSFVGANTRGEWTLRVSDHAGLDVGKLNAWALVIR